MLEMAGQLDRLKAEITRLRQRSEATPVNAEPTPPEERPPHY